MTPPSGPAATRVPGKVLVAALLLGLAHVVLAWHSTRERSMTVDEIFHVTGGYFFNRYGDYRLHPDNGVLPQRLHALPAVLMGAKPPVLAGNPQWSSVNLIAISQQFFYASGNDPWRMLMAARMMNLLFSLGVCALAFAWARSLAGDGPGLLALALAAFSPVMLAHGPLATTDMAAALFLPAGAGLFWWQLRRPSWALTLVSAAIFGAACVVKYSAALLIPTYLALAAGHLLGPGTAPRRPGFIAVGIAVHAVVAWSLIWASFGFRFSGFAPGLGEAHQYVVPWNYVLPRAGWQGPVIAWLRDARLFPEAFLFGYIHTYVGSLSRAAFLAGEYSVAGWRSFFPLAFLWKSTPAELLAALACVAGAVLHWRTLRASWTRFAPLLVFGAVYGATALASHLNIGHRHLLPLYPVLFVAGAAAIAKLGQAARFVALGACCVQLAAAALIHPHHLAYFNGLAGGPTRGWRLLVDSSLDWGQDLPALRRWLQSHNSGPLPEPVFLSYFGSAQPEAYGVSARVFFALLDFQPITAWHSLVPGIYCISATHLQEVYSPVRGEWTLEYEREYQALRLLESDWVAYFQGAETRAPLLERAPRESWERAWRRYLWLRHARLTAYLRARGPDATAGYSIMIYRLTDAELKTALHSPYSAWARAIAELSARADR